MLSHVWFLFSLCAVLQCNWVGVSGVSAVDQCLDCSVRNNCCHVWGRFPCPIFHTFHAGDLHSSHLADIHLWNFQEDIRCKLQFVVFITTWRWAVALYAMIRVRHKPVMCPDTVEWIELVLPERLPSTNPTLYFKGTEIVVLTSGTLSRTLSLAAFNAVFAVAHRLLLALSNHHKFIHWATHPRYNTLTVTQSIAWSVCDSWASCLLLCCMKQMVVKL